MQRRRCAEPGRHVRVDALRKWYQASACTEQPNGFGVPAQAPSSACSGPAYGRACVAGMPSVIIVICGGSALQPSRG